MAFESAVLSSLLDRRAPCEDDEVGERDPDVATREVCLNSFERAQDPGQLCRVVDLPPALRLEADPGAVRATVLVADSEGRGRSPGGGDELRHGEAGVEHGLFGRGDPVGVDDLVLCSRDGVLPEQLLLRYPRAEVALDRTHVAVGQLEPGLGERVRELVGVLVEPPRDLLVDGVDSQ